MATDALIGTFAAADDPQLRQNRCFLYHVIGNGTGRWDVPVGGMGALTAALASAAEQAGAELRTGAPVVTGPTPTPAGWRCEAADGSAYRAAPAGERRARPCSRGLLGDPAPAPAPEGSQLKLNMVLTRLPRLRDADGRAEEAFAGTFHVNESYAQLATRVRPGGGRADPRRAAVRGLLPLAHRRRHPVARAAAAGAQTLTVFALHMPARLFRADTTARSARPCRRRCVARLGPGRADRGLPAAHADGAACLEARTPLELEAELGLPGGHIFHRDLAWPFAESEREVGRWGVETARPNVWICGAGARRGGGVSGIPGHNAARAVLAAKASCSPRIRTGGAPRSLS